MATSLAPVAGVPRLTNDQDPLDALDSGGAQPEEMQSLADLAARFPAHDVLTGRGGTLVQGRDASTAHIEDVELHGPRNRQTEAHVDRRLSRPRIGERRCE